MRTLGSSIKYQVSNNSCQGTISHGVLGIRSKDSLQDRTVCTNFYCCIDTPGRREIWKVIKLEWTMNHNDTRITDKRYIITIIRVLLLFNTIRNKELGCQVKLHDRVKPCTMLRMPPSHTGNLPSPLTLLPRIAT